MRNPKITQTVALQAAGDKHVYETDRRLLVSPSNVIQFFVMLRLGARSMLPGIRYTLGLIPMTVGLASVPSGAAA
jgi:hypothetical protein